MEEGGNWQESKEDLRKAWRKMTESEERLKFWKKMVGLDIGVRELEHIGEGIKEKFRSEAMKGGRSEREVIRLVMRLKLKDERRHQRETKGWRNKVKTDLEKRCSKRQFSKVISMVNKEAVNWRNIERKKYTKKMDHLNKIRKIEEEKQLEICPQEIIEFADLSIFNKDKMRNLKKQNVEVAAIGEVELDDDEIALLSLPPKFAIRRRLDEIEMETDNEMSMAKMRYQLHREKEILNSEEYYAENNNENEKEVKRLRILTDEEKKELKEIGDIESEGRQIFDPLSKHFDHGNKRATDCQENKKVHLPKQVDNFNESVIELIKNKISKTCKDYVEMHCNEKGEQESNLNKAEIRGLRKLRKRIKNKEIIAVKTDKSGKLTVIKRDLYEKIGEEKCKQDRVIDDCEHRKIEKRINDHVRFWTRIMNTGINHDHMERIMSSKQSVSENAATKYYMYKDHKTEGGYRPVVSGCNSDTLGLSNTLSEVVEAVCMAVDNPYEVISSEDMLSRIEECNKEIEKLVDEKDDNLYLENLFIDGDTNTQNIHVETDYYDWETDYMMIGTDVKSLFPSLSALKTGESVRKQFSKSNIKWNNVDWNLVTLYVKCHEHIWRNNEINEIKKYLPNRISNRGRPPSIGTENLEKRYKWSFPSELLTEGTKAKLMGFAIEAAIIFFFNNFVYTFGGKKYIQCGGGPIGARLTMAVARLVMQQWKDDFNDILTVSNIEEIMSGLYVDDGRSFVKLLPLGMRFVKSVRKFVFSESYLKEDVNRGRSKQEVTQEQILAAMNSVNDDLEFTMETHLDFEDKRLPTLSFSLWPGQKGLHYSYFEKKMRNQVLVMERTAMGRQSIMSIMTNELMRRLQVIDDKLEIDETIKVVEQYIQQLINSEYNWKQIRDICVSALTGYKRQETVRKLRKLPKYRSGQQSLKSRMDKKLNEKFNWFKQSKKNLNKYCNNENIKKKTDQDETEKKKCRWQHYRKKKPKIAALEKEIEIKGDIEAKAVLFIQNTKDSLLANQVREMIQSLKPWTGINLKVVERAGDKIQDLLHKSNPWEDKDCERKSCHPCLSSSKSDESEFKSYTKRSIIYETWCRTCLSKDEKKLRRKETYSRRIQDLKNCIQRNRK